MIYKEGYLEEKSDAELLKFEQLSLSRAPFPGKGEENRCWLKGHMEINEALRARGLPPQYPGD